MTTPSLDVTPDAFARWLAARGEERASFLRAHPGGELQASHPELATLAAELAALPDQAAHEGIFLGVGRTTGALLSAVVHRTVRGPAAGGVRHAPYATLGAMLTDGLRLSRAMGRKNALAGLWHGGGKGVIARVSGDRAVDPAFRRALYEEYGAFVTSLRGLYVTAEDVGTTPDDMASVFRTTRFVTCVPPAVGGSGNPSPATARGVVVALEAALEALGRGTVGGKTIAVQGLGQVGGVVVTELLARGAARVVGVDVSAATVEALRARVADPRLEARVVPPGDDSVYDEDCDVFSPCGLGGGLHPGTIPRLRAGLVCGAANNPLLDEARDARALAERGITYVPDFVANRMGIVSCADEAAGTLPDDPRILAHLDPAWDESIPRVVRRVLAEATARGVPPAEAANALADARSLEQHPIFPGRGQQMLAALARLPWHAPGALP